MRPCDRHSADRWILTALAGFLLYAGGPADHVPAASIVGLVALLDEGFYLAVGGVSWIPAVLRQVDLEPDAEVEVSVEGKRIVITAHRYASEREFAAAKRKVFSANRKSLERLSKR